ncbi:MAG: glycerophosphodiester phosphodiesterase [Actinomycetota bacterium]
MEVIGHRGGAALAPENTLAAIRAGLEAGADGVEVDVRMSSDGLAVLMHDPDVSRTTSGSGRVADLKAAELASLGVPTLAAVLELVPVDRRLIVEVKGTPWETGHDPNEPVARAVAALLADRGARRVTVSSFNPIALAIVRTNAPGVSTGVLTPPAFDLRSNLAAVRDGDHDESHVPVEILEESYVAEAHEQGRPVLAWTVNDPDVIRRCRDWGVDGVITDDPPVALTALGR